MTAPALTNRPITDWTLNDWANQFAAEFRDWERHTNAEGDRDTALAQFVLNALTDPCETGTGQLLELIDRARTVTR